MEDYRLDTPLKGNISLLHDLRKYNDLQKDKTLYKFFWVQSGTVVVEIDHVELTLKENELIPLTPLHHLELKEITGTYIVITFNSNFYCIYGHDNEVSCNGFLFNGSANIIPLKLSQAEATSLYAIMNNFPKEYQVKDNLQEEMLRILLKQFIITCTRIARDRLSIMTEKVKIFEIVRQYYILVDQFFKEKKKVQEYADMLHRSPKTLSNIFSSCGFPSPLQIIHERVEAEAKRLLLFTSKSAKEIAYLIGFEDSASFSRFFKNRTGENISEYRKREKRNN